MSNEPKSLEEVMGAVERQVFVIAGRHYRMKNRDELTPNQIVDLSENVGLLTNPRISDREEAKTLARILRLIFHDALPDAVAYRKPNEVEALLGFFIDRVTPAQRRESLRSTIADIEKYLNGSM